LALGGLSGARQQRAERGGAGKGNHRRRWSHRRRITCRSRSGLLSI